MAAPQMLTKNAMPKVESTSKVFAIRQKGFFVPFFPVYGFLLPFVL
jgi:hypothetical protein